MWSAWTEDPVPQSSTGRQIHGRWYVIEMRIHTRLQPIKAKLSQWCYNVDLSEDSLKNWYPNLVLGTTLQSTNKGNFSYLALKNVSHKAPRESFLRLLQDLQTEFKVEITTGWLRWLTGENEDLQFNLTKTRLAVLLLGEGNDQIRSSVRPTKIPWAETSETIFLNVSLALTEDELLLCSIEDEVVARPAPQQICSTRSEHVNQSVDQMDGEHEQKNVIKTEPPDHDTEHDEPFSLSPDLFQSYDQRSSANGASSSATDYQRVNDTTSTPQTFSAQTVKKEASPDTLWLLSTQDIIPWKQENEIHGRWYIFQLMLLDPLERIVAELSQWSTSIDISTEFLRNWSPKLTLGITEESSSQNHNYYLILKNVSSKDIRRSLLHLLEDLKHQHRISVSTGWVRWLTGPKNDCQLDMCISSIKLLLLGSAKEQTAGSVLTCIPWLEKQTVLVFDILLSNTALEEHVHVLPLQESNSVRSAVIRTPPASQGTQPITTADRSTKSARAEMIETEKENLRLHTQVKEHIRDASALIKIRCQCRRLVADKAKFCSDCGRGLYVRCWSCSEELPWNYRHCNMCGVLLNEELLLDTPPASGSPARLSQSSQSSQPSQPSQPQPATASGGSINNDTFLTPHTSTPSLPASVQASTSSQNDVQTSQFSQNTARNPQHRQYGARMSHLSQHNTQISQQSQCHSQTSRAMRINTHRNRQFPYRTSQPRQNSVERQFGGRATQPSQNNPQISTSTLGASVQALDTSSQNFVQTSQFSQNKTLRPQYSQLRTHMPQPGQNNAQLSQQSQFRSQTLRPMQNDTQRDSQLRSQTLQPGQNNAQISQQSQSRSQMLQPGQNNAQISQQSQSRSQIVQPSQKCTNWEKSNQYRARISGTGQANLQISQRKQVMWSPAYEAKVLRDLQQHHYTETGIHVAFTVISRNPLTVQCSVCNVTVNTGSVEQLVPNLGHHLSDDIHNFHLSMLEGEDPVNAIFAWIAGIYKNIFLPKRTLAVCRCDKVEISLLPTDNPYHTIHAHMNSTKHKHASERFVDSEDITIYGKIRKIK
ncbi:uncharacterized protein [Procambarus clarkii]|nr:uncharacterized protein LOC123775035 isoform X3 [Procambarus clarkii]